MARETRVGGEGIVGKIKQIDSREARLEPLMDKDDCRDPAHRQTTKRDKGRHGRFMHITAN